MNWIQIAIDALDRARRNSGHMTDAERRAAFDRLWSEEERLKHSTTRFSVREPRSWP